MSNAPNPNGINEMITASQDGITAFSELNTQYMLAVFHTKKHRNAVFQISLPLPALSEFKMFSLA